MINIRVEDDYGFGKQLKKAIDDKIEMFTLEPTKDHVWGAIVYLKYFGNAALVSVAGIEIGWMQTDDR